MKTNTITKEILFFLYRNHYFNKRHTSIVNVCNKLSHISCKYIKKELNRLYRAQLIRYKQTNHGKDVYLIVKKKNEIEEIISEELASLYSL